MFEILRKSLSTGVVTTSYPAAPAEISTRSRGRPEIDWPNWKNARPATNICPTGAISFEDTVGRGVPAERKRTARLDLGKCIFCGLCADVDKAIRMTNICECAARRRDDLVTSATYSLKPDGTHERFIENAPSKVERLGQQINERATKLLGRSLHIREVDAGSCNGCEIEIVALSSPVYDLERFGIHFVASPRHADMLLVTGPVTRNMELALRKTYDAMPAPRLVVAVGACGCSGGIFGRNYATCGGVDSIIPVDVYIPGCPPNPFALLHGILLAVGRMEPRSDPPRDFESRCDLTFPR